MSQALLQLGNTPPYTLRELVQPFAVLPNVDSCQVISATRLAIRKTGETGFRLFTSTLRPVGNALVSQVGTLTEGLIPFAIGTQWGLADSLGNVRIKPRMDEILQIRNGHILVRKGNAFGVMNFSGKWLLKPLPDHTLAQQHLLPARSSRVNDFLLAYERVFFEDGDSLIRVMKKNLYGFIDLRTATVLLAPQFEQASAFAYGNAVVKTEHGFTLLNAAGRVCPMQMFDFIEPDPLPNRVFYSDDGSDRWMGLLGDKCAILVPGSYRQIAAFHGSFARCSRTGELFNFMDQKGDEVFPGMHFEQVEDAVGGFAVVRQKAVWNIVQLNTADPRPLFESSDRTTFRLRPLY